MNAPLDRHLAFLRAAANGLNAECDRYERELVAIEVRAEIGDTLPPAAPESGITLPSPPPSAPAVDLVIPSGEAQQILSAALDDFVQRYLYLESVASALARMADLSVSK